MNQKINLKELEKKAWTSYFQDGLWEFFIGIMLITSAIRTFTDNFWFTFMIFIGMFIMILGKRYITTPRIGIVKFGQIRKMKQTKLVGVIGLAVIITFILFLSPTFVKDSPRILISVGVAIFIALIFGAIGYYMDYYRFGIYGLMFAIGEILWGLFGIPVGPLAMLVFGTAILIIGIFSLTQFLHKYHLPNKEVASGS